MKTILIFITVLLCCNCYSQEEEFFVHGWVDYGDVCFDTTSIDKNNCFPLYEGYAAFKSKNISISFKVYISADIETIHLPVDNFHKSDSTGVVKTIIFYFDRNIEHYPYKGVLKYNDLKWEFHMYTDLAIFYYSGDII